MAHTLGMTGMDSATEAALRSAFDQALPRLGAHWQFVPEADAGYVVVDMDSMYGPMSWIRLHAAGKQVIGLTSAARTQADHRLGRPVEADALVSLLTSISGQPLVTETASEPVQAEAPPAASTPAPAPADLLPEEEVHHPDPEAAAPPEPAVALEPVTAEPAAAEHTPAETAPAESAAPEPATAEPAAIEPEVATAPEPERTFADWLAPGALSGRWRFERAGTSLAFDADARTYHGPAALKPLAGAFEGAVTQDDLVHVGDAEWPSTASGPAQPLARLQWLGGLLAGKGALLPGFDPAGQYRLLKWPQTEREYPRHFRIATTMMKGPATLAETAAASGVPMEEVADFVNASLATGYAELVPPAAPEPAEPPKATGLLGRLRGR